MHEPGRSQPSVGHEDLREPWVGILRSMIAPGQHLALPAHPDDVEPSISIVVAVRNAAAALSTTLTSVLAKADDTAEVLVIDGGSTDGSQAVIAQHAARLAYS